MKLKKVVVIWIKNTKDGHDCDYCAFHTNGLCPSLPFNCAAGGYYKIDTAKVKK